jgi:hypothetical protein
MFVSMTRLNLKQKIEKQTRMGLFLPTDNYLQELFTPKYEEVLENNATTDDGMNSAAVHYEIETDWNTYNAAIDDHHSLMRFFSTY